jgi:hypothetical protein
LLSEQFEAAVLDAAMPGGLVSVMPHRSVRMVALAVMMRSCSSELRGTRRLRRPGENRRHRQQQQESKKSFHIAESFSVSSLVFLVIATFLPKFQ